MKDATIKQGQSNERQRILKSSLDRCKVKSFAIAPIRSHLTPAQAELEEQKLKASKSESDFAESQTALLTVRRQNRELHAQFEALRGEIGAKAQALIEAEDENIRQQQVIAKVILVCF
jgi:hypothetical protein